jgi:hypothetical protein
MTPFSADSTMTGKHVERYALMYAVGAAVVGTRVPEGEFTGLATENDSVKPVPTTALLSVENTSRMLAPVEVTGPVCVPKMQAKGHGALPLASQVSPVNRPRIGSLSVAPSYAIRKSWSSSSWNVAKESEIGPRARIVHEQFEFGE